MPVGNAKKPHTTGRTPFATSVHSFGPDYVRAFSLRACAVGSLQTAGYEVNEGARSESTGRPSELSNLRQVALLKRNGVAGARPIGYLRVRWAIRQTGDGPVTAETKIF